MVNESPIIIHFQITPIIVADKILCYIAPSGALMFEKLRENKPKYC